MSDAFEQYEPSHPQCVKAWKQLSPKVRRQRWREAIKRRRILAAVEGRRGRESERRALRRRCPAVNRSNFRRWKERYAAFGLDGLVDWRAPPGAEEMPGEVRAALCTLRRADPNIDVEVMVEHVAKHHGFGTSATTVKRVLCEEGLNRRRGPVAANPEAGEQRLELAGMKLVEAACVETGYLQALTTGVMDELAELSLHTEHSPLPDRDCRDEWGRFLPEYNERLRKGPGEELGPGFATVETKRKGLAPERLHANQVRMPIIERKLYALLVSPLLGSGRWDGIRVPRGDLLGELCGYPYMPSTLDLFTRELKYVGVASTLWEIHARLWLQQTSAWGETKRSAVLYIDGTNKPLWTDFFSQSAFVDLRGRVMPALETVSFHSGYGVPLWMLTESGRAPLVKVVPGMLDRLRDVLGADVGRIVVIDAEANSIPFLKGLERSSTPRAWVTRLRPQWLEGKDIFNRNNYRSYRNGDRVRMGLCDFNDPEKKGSTFRARVIEVERRSKGTVTYLGASTLLDEREWKSADIADLYFDRWPNQEANFRAVSQAVGFKDVHGYGKQLVDNISVITELDRLGQRMRNLEHGLERKTREQARRTAELRQQQKFLHRQERRLETTRHYLDERMSCGQRITPALARAAKEHRTIEVEVHKANAVVARRQKALERLETQRARQQAELAQRQERKQQLETRRKIYKHDTELDSVFSVLKVGLVQLIAYVLKEYLGDARMEPVTFLERVATLPARYRTTPELDLVTFFYNHRDPDVMGLLSRHCDAINARRLRTRDGRLLRLHVDSAPRPRLPPPRQRRVNPGDRFARKRAE